MVSMYFIALVLPRHLDEKIRVYKQTMLDQYGCRVGLKSPAHITVIPPFWMEEEKEEQLTMDIGRVSTGLRSFRITTMSYLHSSRVCFRLSKSSNKVAVPWDFERFTGRSLS